MLAHLQNLIGSPGGGGGKHKAPSMNPNDYMDNLLADIKSSMKERYSDLLIYVISFEAFCGTYNIHLAIIIKVIAIFISFSFIED